MRFQDLTGQRFNRLVVLERAHGTKVTAWKCRCDCGNETVVYANNLKNGHTKSCHCRRTEHSREMGQANKRHGAAAAITREYVAWYSAKRRCDYPKNPSYQRYGGRGITMCEEWRTNFQAFLDHVGICPPGHSLDRIDSNGHYEPGNVRWATPVVQSNNRKPPDPASYPRPRRKS